MYPQQDQANKTAREQTINERLNRLSEQFQAYCDRIEGVLARVNGTPQNAELGGTAPTPIRPTQALAAVVDNLEGSASRLRDLAINAERIA